MADKKFTDTLPQSAHAQKVIEVSASFMEQADDKRKEKLAKKKITPEYNKDGTEKRTSRLNLLITTTQREALDILSMRDGESINSIICDLIDKVIEDNKEELEEWKLYLKKKPKKRG